MFSNQFDSSQNFLPGETITGVKFLTLLLEFTERNATKLLTGKLGLVLNASCVRYLNQLLKVSNLKDPELKKLSSRIASFGNFIQKIPQMKLVPTVKDELENREIDLSLFPSIVELELENVKPQLIINFEELSAQLKKIYVTSALDSIEELLGKEITSKAPWHALRELNLSYNHISALSPSMDALKRVERINLSHNSITKIEHFECCWQLSELDLSFNLISSTELIFETLGNIRCLILNNNQLTSTLGLEKLFALEELDLTFNKLDKLDEILRLKDLPCLTSISLVGNSVVQNFSEFRVIVLSEFKDNILLDKVPTSEPEKDKIYERRKSKLALSKKTKRRVPLIGSPSRSPTKNVQESTESPQVNKFENKIQKIKDESGDRWLLILNELQKDKQYQQDAEKKWKTKRESMKIISDTPIVNIECSPSLDNLSNHFNDLPTNLSSNPESSNEPSKEILQENPNKSDIQFISKQSSTNNLINSSASATPSSNIETSKKVLNDSQIQISISKQSSNNNLQISTSPFPISTVEEYKNSLESSLSLSQTSPSSLSLLSKQDSMSQLGTGDSTPLSLSPSTQNQTISESSSLIQTMGSPSNPKRSSIITEESDDEEQTFEEFSVTVRNNGVEENRFLIIKNDVLEELDTITANPVLKWKLKNLVKIETKLQNKESGPILILEFKSTVGQTSSYSSVFYVTENEIACNQLVSLLKPIMEQNSTTKKVKCMSCSFIFDEPQSGKKCPKCKKEFLIDIYTKPEAAEPIENSKQVSSPTVSNSSSSNKEEDGEYDISDDVNMQAFLRINYFTKGASEKFVSFFETNGLFSEKKNNKFEEKKSFILLTNYNVTILYKSKKAPEKDKGLICAFTSNLSSLKLIIVGLSFQNFRIETNDGKLFIFLPRNSSKTGKFLENLQGCIVDCFEALSSSTSLNSISMETLTPAPIMNRDSEYLSNIQQILPDQTITNLHLYVMVFQIVKTSTWKGPLPPKVKGSLDPKTFIIVDDLVLLCDEDYFSWPPLNDKLPSTPQFTLKSQHNISDVVSIKIENEIPNCFTISFEEEIEKQTESWELVSGGKLEMKKVIQMISEKWKDLFKLDLQIIE